MVEVKGIEVDSQTRCGHYKSEIDIIAIKFKCCGDWFPVLNVIQKLQIIRRKFGRKMNLKLKRFYAEIAVIN